MSDTPSRDPLDAALEARNRQIAAVHKISRLLSSTLDLDERLRDILSVSMQAVDASAGTIFLHRPADDKLVFQYVVGEKTKELTGQAIDSSVGVVGLVFSTGIAQITNKPREALHHRADIGETLGFHTESIITVPLKYQEGAPVGAMQILNKRHGDFTANDLEALEIIASIAAAAIENAQLHREAQAAAVAHAVGDLSHDIKNKVTPISLAVATLKPTVETTLHDLDRIASQAGDGTAQEIAQATKWLREDYSEQFDIVMDQVEQVQQYTKLIADALKGSISEPKIEPVDVEQLVEGELRGLDTTARNRGVQIVRKYDSVPRCSLDRFHVGRAVYNLVNNAIPETPSGGTVTVHVWAEPDGEFPKGHCLILEVADTGRGMPPHVLEGILQGNGRTTKKEGTGLGTRIVYNAVLAHHGVFEGESHEGQGTTFRLRLPLVLE